MELKPEFQQTELGRIPADWAVKSLGELGEALIGLTYAPADVSSDGILVLRSSNVQDGGLRFDDNVFVRKAVPTRIMVKPGDILICVRNGSRELIGKCALIDGRAKGMTFGAFMAVFRTPFSSFIYHQFTSDVLKRQIHEHLGATINQITNKSLNSFRIPFPSEEVERQRIAAALIDMDALLSALDRLIAKKRNLKLASMQQLLTGQTRLPGFGGKWEMVRAGDVGRFKGGSGFPTSAQGAAAGDYPFFKVSDMNHAGNDVFMIQSNNWISEDVRKHLGATVFPAGSVVFAKVGAAVFLERKKLLAKPSCLDNNMAAFIVQRDRLEPRFAHLAFLHTKIGDLVSTTALPSLSGSVLAQIPLQVPPLDEQIAIMNVVSDMDVDLRALEQRRDKTRLLKQGMMQELLMGRTRLV